MRLSPIIIMLVLFGSLVFAQFERPDKPTQTRPKAKPLKFETIRLNEQGGIIARDSKTVEYFTEKLNKDVGIRMVRIPRGTFLMGSDTEAEHGEDEGPQHDVALSEFWIGQYEITQRQWMAVMGNNPSYFKENEYLPVESLEWKDADLFCKKLSKKTGRHYRLPTESEWEYACRAGSTSPITFGDSLTSEYENFDGSKPYGEIESGQYREKTMVVGSFSPNGFGLYDMSGNVREWCSDWYGPYPAKSQTNPTGPRQGEVHVLRGGSWASYGHSCRSANRNTPKEDSLNAYGLRVVMSER